MVSELAKQHTRGMLIGLGVIGVLLLFWLVRKVFAKKNVAVA